LAVRDPAIATQELLKWHEKYAAGDQYKILALHHKNLQNGKKHMQEDILKQPNSKTGRRNKRDCQTNSQREKTEETDRQYLILVIKNSQTFTITM
jgi:hypothetical protein